MHGFWCVRLAVALLCLAWASAVEAQAPGAAPLKVVFQLNDAYEKDKVLPGVQIGVARAVEGDYEQVGTTDAGGRWATALAAGTYFVTYKMPGFVTLERTETPIRSEGQLVTTTLSMNLESVGLEGKRRIAIVLNWGSEPSQVKDADSHLACGCGPEPVHVYFSNKRQESQGREISLDVDDTDWGGPETIQLVEPGPGTYWYWVYDYSGSGPPAALGASDVVVRVLDGDRVAGEYRPPKDLTSREWRPFDSIVVDKLGDVRIVPFTEEALGRGEALRLPPEAEKALETIGPGEAASFLTGLVTLLVILLVVFLFGRAVWRRATGRRGAGSSSR